MPSVPPGATGLFRSSKSAQEKQYQAECDHRTLTDAAEIRSDKSRLAGVAVHHSKQMAKMRTVGRSLRGRGRT